MTSAPSLQLSVGEHVVHFYDDERSLAVVAAGCLETVLTDGGAAIAIATAAHRAAFATELACLGVDVASAERNGTLVFLDARTTLDQLLVDGIPDAARFRTVIAPAIAALAPIARPVCAFGEMVGLLWDAGDIDGVIALEGLWNDLLAETPFSLLCGYPATVFEAGGAAESVLRVCDAHSEVVCSLPTPARPAVSRAFPAAIKSPARARAFLADTLAEWDCRDDLHVDAALVVTELAVNAITHARSGFSVSLDRIDDRIRITVGDADPTPPARRGTDLHATNGRGLLLVDAVAAAWGTSPTTGGKLVWAEIGGSTEGRR